MCSLPARRRGAWWLALVAVGVWRASSGGAPGSAGDSRRVAASGARPWKNEDLVSRICQIPPPIFLMLSLLNEALWQKCMGETKHGTVYKAGEGWQMSGCCSSKGWAIHRIPRGHTLNVQKCSANSLSLLLGRPCMGPLARQWFTARC